MSADPLDIVIPDTQLERARQKLATCQRKLAEQTDKLSRYYYEKCIEGHRRDIARIEAQQH